MIPSCARGNLDSFVREGEFYDAFNRYRSRIRFVQQEENRLA
jgi:hypothetical protein